MQGTFCMFTTVHRISQHDVSTGNIACRGAPKHKGLLYDNRFHHHSSLANSSGLEREGPKPAMFPWLSSSDI
jgi:hypothetical protein